MSLRHFLRANKTSPLVILLLLLSTLALSPPIQGNGQAEIAVDPQITTVKVCNTFTISIVIRNIPAPMTGFTFTVTWDTSQMEYEGHTIHLLTGWTHTLDVNPDEGRYTLTALTTGEGTTEDHAWAEINFHCLREGSSPINIDALLFSDETPITPLVVKGAVNQISTAPPPRREVPVGGEVYSANKLIILGPYIALAAVALVTVLAIRKKR